MGSCCRTASTRERSRSVTATSSLRSAISDAPVSFQPLAVVGDIPGADFDLNDIPALADWIEAQMPAL